jgi:glycosyltransferase involved in cell wall biosynthesis
MTDQSQTPGIENAKVTIGIPTYNRAALLRETLDSVLSQTRTDFRVVVSDNASDDDTSAVVESFQDSRIQYVRHRENVGMVANLNHLIGLATTDYLLLLPDDDVLYPEYLSTVVKILEESRTAGVVHTVCDVIDEHSSVIDPAFAPIEPPPVDPHRSRALRNSADYYVESGHRYIERNMKSRWPICYSSAICRTAAILEAGGFIETEEPYSDIPLWLRVALVWDFAFVPRALVGFRVHSDTMTARAVTDGRASSDPEGPALLHAQIRFERHSSFISQAPLSTRRARRYRTLATTQLLVERATRGVPWMDTTRGLIRLVSAHPLALLHPAVLRLTAAQLGGRRLRRTLRGLTTTRTAC